MKVTDHINKSDKTLFSFELLPPLKGEHFGHIEEKISQLLSFNPAYINVTYHQQEIEYETLKSGLLRKRTIRKRPGTVGISAAIQYKTNIDVVPHLICGGFSKEDTENALIDLHFLGIDNLLLLRGDPPATQRYFKAEAEGNAFAVDLVKQVKNMNNGVYLDENLANSHPSNFCIGVAGYPEKHSESPNRNIDLRYLKEKVDAGADFIVTQMFFDNKKFFRFEKACREIGIDVPIIPGIKPISTLKQMLTLPQIFHIDLPDSLVSELLKCKTNADVYQVGIEWGIAQSKELVDFGVPALHYYTMGKADNICAIAEEVF